MHRSNILILHILFSPSCLHSLKHNWLCLQNRRHAPHFDNFVCIWPLGAHQMPSILCLSVFCSVLERVYKKPPGEQHIILRHNNRFIKIIVFSWWLEAKIIQTNTNTKKILARPRFIILFLLLYENYITLITMLFISAWIWNSSTFACVI